jgi:hypothetical protein
MHIDERNILLPDQRRRELAELLARGLRRLCEARRIAADTSTSETPQNPTEIIANCLAIPGETVLSVHTG